MKEIAETSVSLDENTVKIMILKLIQVEKLLKEMGKTSTKFHGRVDHILQHQGTQGIEKFTNKSSKESNSNLTLNRKETGSSKLSHQVTEKSNFKPDSRDK